MLYALRWTSSTRVRELIRRRGLAPFSDPGPVRVLVRDVVADYSERVADLGAAADR